MRAVGPRRARALVAAEAERFLAVAARHALSVRHLLRAAVDPGAFQVVPLRERHAVGIRERVLHHDEVHRLSVHADRVAPEKLVDQRLALLFAVRVVPRQHGRELDALALGARLHDEPPVGRPIHKRPARTLAERLARDAGAFIWNNFFAPFGFNAAIAAPGEGPWDPPATFEAISEAGLVIHGSPSTVNRKIEALLETLPVDFFWMFIYNHVPHAALMRSFELLTNEVWPNFTDKIKASGGRKAASAG